MRLSSLVTPGGPGTPSGRETPSRPETPPVSNWAVLSWLARPWTRPERPVARTRPSREPARPGSPETGRAAGVAGGAGPAQTRAIRSRSAAWSGV